MLWDPIREIWVETTPEEKVRQMWLQAMLSSLGFPRGLISVEQGIQATSRRSDILVFYRKGSDLLPLLVIECKRAACEGARAQVEGYNSWTKAPFWAVISATDAETFWQTESGVHRVPFLPLYQDLLRHVEAM
jgi:hypothetical protein